MLPLVEESHSKPSNVNATFDLFHISHFLNTAPSMGGDLEIFFQFSLDLLSCVWAQSVSLLCAKLFDTSSLSLALASTVYCSFKRALKA